MLKKNLVLLAFLLLPIAGITGCITSKAPTPSVCDSISAGDSQLCTLAAKSGQRLEDIGSTLIVANMVAIGSGAYTQEQARLELVGLRASLDSPITYVAMQGRVRQTLSKSPGLFIIATLYLDQLGSDQIISPVDSGILKSWLDRQINTLTMPAPQD
jgi:hypothetical protein